MGHRKGGWHTIKKNNPAFKKFTERIPRPFSVDPPVCLETRQIAVTEAQAWGKIDAASLFAPNRSKECLTGPRGRFRQGLFGGLESQAVMMNIQYILQSQTRWRRHLHHSDPRWGKIAMVRLKG